MVDQESGKENSRNGHFRLSKLLRFDPFDEKENTNDLAELQKLLTGFEIEQSEVDQEDILAIVAEEADRVQNENPSSKLKKELEEMKVK